MRQAVKYPKGLHYWIKDLIDVAYGENDINLENYVEDLESVIIQIKYYVDNGLK